MTDPENAVVDMEGVIDSLEFLSDALPEYPHAGGHQAIAAILKALAQRGRLLLKEIHKARFQET